MLETMKDFEVSTSVRALMGPTGHWVRKWGQINSFLQKELDALNPSGQLTHQLDWDLPKEPDDTRFIPSVSEATVHLLLEKLHEYYWQHRARTAHVEYEKQPVPRERWIADSLKV